MTHMTSGMGSGVTVNIPWDSLGCSPARTAMGLDGVGAAGHRPHHQATRTEVQAGEALNPATAPGAQHTLPTVFCGLVHRS